MKVSVTCHLIVFEDIITPYYDTLNHFYRYDLRIENSNPIKMDTIELYINNSLISTLYHINKLSYYQLDLSLYYLNDSSVTLKVMAKTYDNEEQKYNVNNGAGELIEYNNNYLRTDVDKNRVVNHFIKLEKPYAFEFEMMGNPALEIGDTILFENVDGYKKGIITSIEFKYNGGITAIIKGECENVL